MSACGLHLSLVSTFKNIFLTTDRRAGAQNNIEVVRKGSFLFRPVKAEVTEKKSAKTAKKEQTKNNDCLQTGFSNTIHFPLVNKMGSPAPKTHAIG